MKGQTQVVAVIISVVLASIVLLVGLILYSNVDVVTRSIINQSDAFVSTTVVNESLTTGNQTQATDNFPLVTTGLVIMEVNHTANVATTLTTTGAKNYTIISLENGTIQIQGINGDNRTNITYRYLTGDAFSAYDNTIDQGYNGFDLGAVIPLILFAAAIIGLLATAFAFGRNQ